MSSEEQSKRIPVYEQLGDPKVIVHGRILHQKRIRKLLRLTPFSISIALAVWEESYWRWRGLTELVAVSTSDDIAIRSSDASSLHQVSDRFVPLNLLLNGNRLLVASGKT